MKKLLLICGLLWSALASAQFVPGQVLTAAELNSQFALYALLTGATFTGPLTSPSITSTSTTQGRLDNTTSLATDAFVNQQGASAVATVPFAGVTGGTYNQATQGSGAQIVVFASGGVVTSSLTISNPGTGYAVGDLLALPSGNSDAVLRVTGVSGGGVTSVGIAYGGSGYTTGNQVTAQAVPPGRRAVVFTGTLTSNLTFIIQNGTFLTASREVEFINNTTGAFTITVKLSNGAGGSTGTGVVLPQGTSNSTALAVYTDGVNDVWLANAGAAVVGGPGAFTTLSASSTVSGAGFTTLLGAYAPLAGATFTGPVSVIDTASGNTELTLSSVNNANGVNIKLTGNGATTPGKSIRVNSGNFQILNNAYSAVIFGLTDAGDITAGGIDSTPVGSTTPSTGSFTTLAASSTVSGTGFSNYLASPPAIGGTAAAAGAFTTLSSTGNFTPSQTNGIVGTTTNNNANAGSVGEYISSPVLVGSAVPVTTNTPTNITSISLTAGDWDVWGSCWTNPAGTTVTNVIACWTSTVSATNPTAPNNGGEGYVTTSVTAGALNSATAGLQRISIASPTTIFLSTNVQFSVSTNAAYGFIGARRRR